MGPNWRDGGDIQYILMSNYDDPDYGQTCSDIMSKPVRMPLTVPAHRGAVAYDLFPADSPIRKFYEWPEFTRFVAAILGHLVLPRFGDQAARSHHAGGEHFGRTLGGWSGVGDGDVPLGGLQV